MTSSTTTVPTEIVQFAAQVRAALADLPADEVDDLTDGLEADLAEAYAEDLARELPDPADYAAELRTAAGLPVRTRERAGVRGAAASLLTGFRETARDVERSLRKNAAVAGALDFLVSLRPVWWLARAFVAFALVFALFLGYGTPFPRDLGQLLLLGVLCLVSVQWGRGRWTFAGLAPVIVVGNVIAALAILPVLGSVYNDVRWGYYGSGDTEPMYYESDLTGVYLNGAQVTNIFAYGPDGEPLTQVQLFDQDGNPLATSVPGGNGCLDPECLVEGAWVPVVLETGAQVWNVFPMSMVEGMWNENGVMVPRPGADPLDRPAPFVKVPAVGQAATDDTSEKVADGND